MHKLQQLNDLTPPELILLQKHIDLGIDHLISVLGVNRFHEFLSLSNMGEETYELIKANKTEVYGNLISILNTIITASFGGWMGFSAVMELNLSSPYIFIVILSLTTLAGAVIGYHNYYFTQQQAKKTLQTLQVLQLELQILKEIYRKRQREFKEIQQILYDHVAEYLSIPVKTHISGWLSLLYQVVDSKLSKLRTSENYPLVKRKISALITNIKSNFDHAFSEKDVTHPIKTKRFLNTVTETLLNTYPKAGKTSGTWVNTNVLIFLIPTILGTFSSLFVYLTGSTQIAEAFEYHNIVAILSSPYAKALKVAITLLITTYFGFSFLYNYRKNHKRNHEIENRKEKIIKSEASMTVLDERLFTLRRVSEDVEKIFAMLLVADKK